jgi:hypothetical protein
VKELGLEKVRSLEEANRFLETFLPRFNAGFTQDPAEPESAYLPVPEELELEALFCFKHLRKVRNDNTISFSGHVLQIPPDEYRGNYARCRVEVRQHMEGRLSIWYQDRELITVEPEMKSPPRVGKFTPAVKIRRPEPSPNGKNQRPQNPKAGSHGSHLLIIPGENR